MSLLPNAIAETVGLAEGYSAVQEVAKVQKAVFPMFKEPGFRSKGRCFNTANPDGTVRVVHFVTMPATSCSYGHFNVEIGVYIPELWDFEYGAYGAKRPKTLTIADCEIRQSVDPPHSGHREDQQWEAIAKPEMITILTNKVDAAASAFFARFADRAAIMAELAKPGTSVPWVRGRAPIVLAIIEAAMGNRPSALDRLQSYLDGLDLGTRPNIHHANHVRDIIARL